MQSTLFDDGQEVKLYRRWCDMVLPFKDDVVGKGLADIDVAVVTLGTSDIDESYKRFLWTEVRPMFNIRSFVFEKDV